VASVREWRRPGSEAEEDRGHEEVTVPVAVDFCADPATPHIANHDL
jgi:hypothetical protein